MIALACGLLALGCFFFVFAPVRGGEVAHGEVKDRLTYLRERKAVLYENLRDLNFEYRAGKFPPADYEAMRSTLEQEGAQLLAEIDRLEAAEG